MLEIFRADMLNLLRYKQAREALGLNVTPPLKTSTTLKLSNFTQAESTDKGREMGQGGVHVSEETMDDVHPQLLVCDGVNYGDFINFSPSPS
jgi:hypothetical protein